VEMPRFSLTMLERDVRSRGVSARVGKGKRADSGALSRPKGTTKGELALDRNRSISAQLLPPRYVEIMMTRRLPRCGRRAESMSGKRPFHLRKQTSSRTWPNVCDVQRRHWVGGGTSNDVTSHEAPAGGHFSFCGLRAFLVTFALFLEVEVFTRNPPFVPRCNRARCPWHSASGIMTLVVFLK
jgi:hypothetical protein